MATIDDLRLQFQKQVCSRSMFRKPGNTPSIADTSSKISTALSKKVIAKLGHPLASSKISSQTAGRRFEEAVCDYVEAALTLLSHLRPAKFIYNIHVDISSFHQYSHLADLKQLMKGNKQLQTTLGSYVVKPDVIVGRKPITDEEINVSDNVVNTESYPKLTQIRESNQEQATEILHASISCKLTLRSDRSQNARTEGLNLIRHRKGHSPHIVVVTAEPMPTRISSLALGTGDIDCVYHFSLHELVEATKELGKETATELLDMMISGNRLRDISDLPFDLVV